MSAFLLVLLAALPVPPTDRALRSEFALGVEVGHDQVLPAGATEATDASRAELRARLTLFPGGVRDDATPIALQPFLQRASSISVGVLAGYLDAPPALAGGDLAASARRAGVGVAAEVFVTRALAVTGASGYQLADSPPGRQAWAVPFRAGLALQVGPLRIKISYDGAYLRDTSDRFVSRIATDLRAVFVNHIDLQLGAVAGPGRVEAYFQATYYPSRRLGLTAGGFGGGHDATLVPEPAGPRGIDGQAPIELPGAAHFGCRIGFSYWPSPALGVAAHYGATWISGDTAGATDQLGVLTLIGRSP